MKTDGARAGVSEPDVRAGGEYALRAEFFISPCFVQSLIFLSELRSCGYTGAFLPPPAHCVRHVVFYMRSTTALANPEQLTSVAPSIIRAKS